MFVPDTYPTFLQILRSIVSFEPVATAIEEEVDRLCDNNLSSPSPYKKYRKYDPTGKENVTAAENCSQSDKSFKNCRENASLYFKELETQHQKPLEDIRKVLADRLAALKACHKREQEFKENIDQDKREIAALNDSLCLEQTEKEDLQRALNEAEEKLSATEEKLSAAEEKINEVGEKLTDALSGLKKSQRKSKTSLDECQRKLIKVGGILCIDKKSRTPPPPYSVT